MRCIITHGNCYHYEDSVEKRSAGSGHGSRYNVFYTFYVSAVKQGGHFG